MPLLILSSFGMLVTAYLIYQHYKPAGGSFCNVDDFVNCDIVNKSIYSEIFGIPVSIIGFAAYVFFFIIAFALFLGKKIQKNIILFSALFAGASVLFSLYLTYIEFFVLDAVCILCLTQQILILLIFITILHLWRNPQKYQL